MTAEPQHPVGEAIREVRKQKDMTQAALADALGIAQPYVSAWETFRLPTIDQVADLEAALKVPHGTILRRAGYVTDTDDLTLEQHIALDQTISRDARRVLIGVVEADRAKGQYLEAGRRNRRRE